MPKSPTDTALARINAFLDSLPDSETTQHSSPDHTLLDEWHTIQHRVMASETHTVVESEDGGQVAHFQDGEFVAGSRRYAEKLQHLGIAPTVSAGGEASRGTDENED